MAGKQPKRKPRPGMDEYGRTPLHYAALDSDATAVKKHLALGANAGAVDNNGWTPLHFAAQSHAVEVAKLLLEAGAPVDVRDLNGNTPLSTAVMKSRDEGELIKLLRSFGADPNVDNNYGISPLKLARTIANYDIRQFFSDLP
jgi:ankyrin repeat protein